MFGMSVMDIIHSLAVSFSTFPAPIATTNVIFASGNSFTCAFQGFLTVFGLSAFYYNASLSVYFLLVSRYRRSEEWVKNKVEYFLHALPLVIGFSGSLTALVTDTLQFSVLRCFMENYPKDCWYNEDVECIRGANSVIMRLIFIGIPGNLTMLSMIISSVSIFLYTRRIEGNDRKPSDCVARIAFMYCGSSILCYLWGMVVRGQDSFNQNMSFTMALLISIFHPLQGFFNYWVFFYRRSLSSKATKFKSKRTVNKEAANYFDRLDELSDDEDLTNRGTNEPSPW